MGLGHPVLIHESILSKNESRILRAKIISFLNNECVCIHENAIMRGETIK